MVKENGCPRCGKEVTDQEIRCQCGYLLFPDIYGFPLPEMHIARINRLATPRRRFFGYLLDVVAAICIWSIGYLLSYATENFVFYIVGWFLMLPYLLLADGLPNGQSVGKILLEMRVVRIEDGQPCKWEDSFTRNFAMFLGPFDWSSIFNEPHQRRGDKIAGTLVICTNP